MADNVAITAGTGTNIATDDIGGVQYQRVKNGFGVDGSFTDVSSTNPMPQYIPATGTSGSITATDAVLGTHGGLGVLLSGTPTASSYVAWPIQGEGGFTLQLTGSFGGGTVWVESSVDSTNGVNGSWTYNLVRQSGVDETFVDASLTSAGAFRGTSAGYSYMRVRITGATAPNVAVVWRGAGVPSVTAQVASLPPGKNTIGAVRQAVGTPTKTNYTITASSATVLSANTSRRGARFVNDSAVTFYLDESGGTASATSYTVKLLPNDIYDMGPLVSQSAITGIGSSASGTIRVTEWV
jgi:hypothetical protein